MPPRLGAVGSSEGKASMNRQPANPSESSKKMSYAEVIAEEEREEFNADENFKALVAVLSEMMNDGEALSLAHRLRASVEKQLFQDQSGG
jgi:hypothetical protein